jgi:phage FluMu protein Com
VQRLLPAVSKGHAVISEGELRCDRPRKDDPTRQCRKMIAKANKLGQIAGNFLCERCKEVIEVRLVEAQMTAKRSSTRFGETHELTREVFNEEK